ncbi:hypothetical protein [Nocardia terpenica]|uniref:Protein kinase domain-containing protein n=1 Tax=Nocardia terpenica TaxID=455432 RepID=A0A6G9Z6T2_9NOCA|nr:hypothetical protein [Nocardia terpenica]QIS21160.1 hypothetical protein F6W96_25385 [Nocardia terpenica]
MVHQQRLKRSALGALQKLAEGGQGVVYHAPNAHMRYANSMVYKEYKPNVLPTANVAALEAMPDYLESLPFAEGFDLLSRTAWPCRLVEEDASTAVIGFVMPTIPSEFFIDLTVASGVKSTTAQFQHLLNDNTVLARRNIMLTDRSRYELLIQAADSLSVLHRQHIAIGDMSPLNLLFALQPDPRVYLIDCDAMRLADRTVTAQVETPDWEVRQANPGEQLATPQSDAYKLGLLALRLLAGDQTTRDTDRLPSAVPTAIRQLVAAALSTTPADRPVAADWIPTLTDAAHTASTHLPQPATSSPLPRRTARQPAAGPPTPTRGPGQLPPPSGPMSRGHRRARRLAAVAAVALVITTGILLTDHRGTGNNNSGPGLAGSRPVTTCADPPKAAVASATAAGDSLDLSMNIVAACSQGDVLSSSRTQVIVSTPAGTVASGTFNLSAAPLVLPSSTQPVQKTFRYPSGQFWQPADTLSPTTDLTVQLNRAGTEGPVHIANPVTGGVLTASPLPTTAADVEAMSLAGLQATAAADRTAVLRNLSDRWVPQLSSKQFGLVAEGITWHHTDIMREHLRLRERHPNVRLLWSGTWSTFSYPDFWITIAGVAFPTPDGAIQWCGDNGFDRDHCYAKLISTTHPVDGSTQYQP